MSEEENVSVETEASQPVAPAAESENVQEQKASSQEKRQKNDVEYNWAEARRKMQELERKAQEQQEVINKLQKPALQDEVDEIDKLGDEDIVTKAQAKKLAAKMAKEIAQDVLRQREAATVDERLGLKFPDFGEIVTKENIELLKEQEPELALSLYHNPDPYAQGVAAYKLLKKTGIGAKEANSLEKKKAMENSQKPVSVNAAAKHSALGNAHLFENGLTKELKGQLWKEMQDAMKRA